MRGATQLPMDITSTVQSVVKSQRNGPLIAAAAQLWIRPDDSVLDVTFGRGLFWTDFQPEHLETHDLRLDGVDFRHLPEKDASVDVVVFDPPYVLAAGRDNSTLDDFHDRYGLYEGPRNVVELRDLLADGISEAARVLCAKGRLLVKCMDFIEHDRYEPMRHFVVQTAFDLGLAQVDEFVHNTGTGPHQKGNQVHSRRAHSFLCVFQKPKGSRP